MPAVRVPHFVRPAPPAALLAQSSPMPDQHHFPEQEQHWPCGLTSTAGSFPGSGLATAGPGWWPASLGAVPLPQRSPQHLHLCCPGWVACTCAPPAGGWQGRRQPGPWFKALPHFPPLLAPAPMPPCSTPRPATVHFPNADCLSPAACLGLLALLGRCPPCPPPLACPAIYTPVCLQKNGAQFEAVVRAREARNPRFAFLSPRHRHHRHYR